MPATVLVLNGPNLNMLGTREPELYGHQTLADVEALCRSMGGRLGLAVETRQSNAEADLVGWIQRAEGRVAGIVINPAALSHSSVAILDALNLFSGPVIEVHISNIHRREAFRHHSYVSQRADGIIAGCGVQGYALALRRVAAVLPDVTPPTPRKRAGSKQPTAKSGGDEG